MDIPADEKGEVNGAIIAENEEKINADNAILSQHFDEEDDQKLRVDGIHTHAIIS